MPSPLLETKLHVPGRRRSLVPRARLHVPMDDATDARLTLVSAPAGFGKTTLLAEWVAGLHGQVAWVSLDERDDEPATFWAYVAAALGRPELSTPPVDADALVPTLLNELSAAGEEVTLVLDDYHVVTTPEIHEAVGFLVEHLPPQARLVLATRADPPLPLARLRARGELVELRAADLRFTVDETEAYLNGPMALDLGTDDVAVLEDRTEGWAAALQLAALSMQGRKDPSTFIAGFAGDDRYVVDYLAGEVLARQPDEVRTFLLETSLLARLTGPLCDALTGRTDGAATLERLERANLFLVPLDDRRRWYRYHHLFADVLRARLHEENPERVVELHRRAHAWYDRHDEPAEAIRHALAGGDPQRAADVIERVALSLTQTRQEATLRTWLEALPVDLFVNRPVLTIHLVGVRMVDTETTGVEALLQQAERWLAPTDAASSEMVVIDEETFRRLPAQIEVYRAGLALLRGDVEGTIAHGEHVLELLEDDDQLRRGSACALLALAHWTKADLDRAGDLYAEAVPNLRAAGWAADSLGCALALADIRIAQGRLHDAVATYEQGLAVATGDGERPVLRGGADMHVGLSSVLREVNDLDAAHRHLDRAIELGDHAGLPQNAYRRRVAEARLREVEGDLDGALRLLEEAERRYVGDYSPDVRPVAAMRARLQVGRGDLRDARRWADERGLTAEDDLSYRREFEHLALARLLLAEGSRDAESFLARLQEAAEAGGRTGSAIETLVLQARALQEVGDVRAALVPLARALVLAEPEGFVRVFLDEGPPMIRLLEAAAKHGAASDQARRVLDAGASSSAPASAPRRQQGLADPLSERELDVLRLLRTDLTGPEIARELVVSLNTVRTHTKHIFTKLGATNRRAAVRRADELGL